MAIPVIVSREPLRLLIVEDSAADVALLTKAFGKLSTPVDATFVENAEQALAHLLGEAPLAPPALPNAVLLDLKLPGMTGLELLTRIKSRPRLRTLPVVILTSSRYPADLTRAYELQATACFVKPMTGYGDLLERIVAFLDAATPPPEPSQVLADSAGASPDFHDTFLEALVESAADAIVAVDRSGRAQTWNAAAERLYGRSPTDVRGRHLGEVVEDDRHGSLERAFRELLEGRGTRTVDTSLGEHDHRREISWNLSSIVDDDGVVKGVSMIARDVTEAKQAERQFRLAVESSPSGMVMVDDQGRILLVNAETERLFGWARDELIGQPLDLLVPERFRGAHRAHRRGFVEQPETRAMGAGRELYGLRKDGTEFPVEIGLNPIKTGDGVMVLSSVVDITERKQAEERFRLAVEASPSGIVMVDDQGLITLANAETERMFGYERGELEGESVDMLVPEPFRARHGVHRRGFAAHPEARAMGSGRDLFGRRKDGTEFPVEIGLNPIETSEGTMVLSTIVDITDRRKTVEALTRQTDELARSNADLEQFAYVASHDLQEPLRMVAGFTQLLVERLGTSLDAEAREYVEMIQGGALRMGQLLHDLLSYSRVTTRGESPSAIAPRPHIDRALANLAMAIEEADATVEIDEPIPEVLADPAQLTMVVQNLVANAIKFRREAPVKVHLRATREEGQIVFEVEDNGIGIPAAQSDRIFDVFERLHPQHVYPGTGIGLAICKRIVERHGGRIGVTSGAEGGSVFYFTLPAA